MSDMLARTVVMTTFGPKLRAAIARKGTSVPKLAEYLAARGIEGASKSAIYDWQDDKSWPNAMIGGEIARYLQVSLDFLTNDDLDEPEPPELTEDDAYVVKVFRDSGITASTAARAIMKAAAVSDKVSDPEFSPSVQDRDIKDLPPDMKAFDDSRRPKRREQKPEPTPTKRNQK